MGKVDICSPLKEDVVTILGLLEVGEMITEEQARRDDLPDCVDMAFDLVGSVADEWVCDDGGLDDNPDDGNVDGDVASGVRLGLLAAATGGRVFSGEWTDSDERALHFYFVAKSREEVIEKIRKAFERP